MLRQTKGSVRNAWIEGPFDGAWSFQFSDRMSDVQDNLYDMAETMADSPSKSEKKLRNVIEKNPYAFDAYNQLAFILWYGQRSPKVALEVLTLGLSKAKELFPERFELGKSQLPWAVLENRPFLRMYESLGSRHLELGELKQAIKVFEDIITMNPGDNQGVRETLCICYFRSDNPGAVLALCDVFEEDGMPAIEYGRILALLRLGRKDEAERVLKDALKYSENVAIEIARNKHKRLKPEDDLRPIEMGSRFEAELYWMHFGKFWEETRGAVEFVREHTTMVSTE